MKPTENQQLAIDIRDANVLVSAAAGSGKTSVLVERIIGRITSTDDPVDVDRLLIMTFTNAAAAEMQDRIRDAIDLRLNELRKDENADKDAIENLERQSILVHNAQITTIHGFCKSVIGDHFEEVSLDPNFRVADDNECKLIMQDALEECLEAAYEKGDPAFLAASERFSAAKNDSGFEGLIIPIYRFISADPEPEDYARRCCGFYDYGSYDEFAASKLMEEFTEYIRNELAILTENIKKAEDLIAAHPDVAPYKANIDAYSAAFSAISGKIAGKKDIYDIIRTGLSRIDAPAFGSIRNSKLDAAAIEAKEEVAQLRNDVKSGVAKLLEMMPFDLKTSYEHIVAAKPHLRALIETVIEFGRVYEAKKRADNLIDFNDMEHLAAKILKNPDIAAIYREHFIEIYVDEYQDSNTTQEHLVNLICRRDPGNVFQVGDVKQSIYRFRMARPDLFISKYNTYSDAEGAPERRILLNENFRSRREVTDAVNEVFSAIMKEDMGGIEYDDDAKLKQAATCYEEPPAGSDPYRCEMLLGACEDLSSEEFIANIIATRIVSMIRDGFTVYDKEAKITRPASFGDFTILVRSIKKYESVFREVFTAANIPLAVSGSEGYFGTIEVQTALAFLSAVDNPLCDIELAALMLSPVCGFSDEDLAMITAAVGNKMCLYNRIKAVAKNPPEDHTEIDAKLRNKCSAVLELLNRYQVMSTYTPVHGILSDFIDREYGDYVKCMNKGPQRMANLEMLLAKAEDFGKTSFKGLYRFVRYMDQIRKYEIDDGEAGIAGENDDVVKIMTMHGSKGLEFPVCFVAGIDKKRNTMDESGKVIWNEKYGFGIDHADTEKRFTGVTIPKTFVRRRNRIDSVAEEMRILYVAMTRAREKLIMVGCADADSFPGKKKSPDSFMSYLDMLSAAHKDSGFKHIDITYLSEADLVAARFEETMAKESGADELAAIVRSHGDNITETDEADNSTQMRSIPEYLADVKTPYPHPLNPELRAKLSVSDIKHKAIEEMIESGLQLAPEGEQLFTETQPDKYIPKFMRSEGETATGGTFYGTAFHRIMELWDYPAFDGPKGQQTVTAEEVRSFAKKMHEKHRMDSEQIEAINAEDVAFFLNSPLGVRMRDAKAAGKLFREQPFVIGVPDSGETVLVQGIIDAYYIEDDGITIVDYKTDRVSSEQMLIDRYRTQLEYYGKALTQITGMPVKALTVYSTRLRKEIVIA